MLGINIYIIIIIMLHKTRRMLHITHSLLTYVHNYIVIRTIHL